MQKGKGPEARRLPTRDPRSRRIYFFARFAFLAFAIHIEQKNTCGTERRGV